MFVKVLQEASILTWVEMVDILIKGTKKKVDTDMQFEIDFNNKQINVSIYKSLT